MSRDLSRRDWLAVTAAGFMGLAGDRRAAGQASPVTIERRIERLIAAYENEGLHRTGTDTDRRSADALCDAVRQAGLEPATEPFTLGRIDVIEASLVSGERRIEGIPLFDGAFTDRAGVRGRLGSLDSDAPIGFAELVPNRAANGAIGDARRANRHRALVCVSRGGRPGLCPSNADSFLQPFGPPVLQVSSQDGEWLGERSRAGAEVQLVAAVSRTNVSAVNVTTRIRGADPSKPAMVIMTPRSGWGSCASERGGGLACWLEIMRAFRETRPLRDLEFVASSGHELGHLGINDFVDRRPGVVKKSLAWLHLGANIGAATDPRINLQASDDEMDTSLSGALSAAGLVVTTRTPRGTIPGGEAEAVARGGGRFVSIIGGNALFHNPADHGPGAVDFQAAARFAGAFVRFLKPLAI